MYRSAFKGSRKSIIIYNNCGSSGYCVISPELSYFLEKKCVFRISPNHCPTVLFVLAGKALSDPAWRRSEGHTHPEAARIVQVKGLEVDSRLRGNDKGDAGMAF